MKWLNSLLSCVHRMRMKWENWYLFSYSGCRKSHLFCFHLNRRMEQNHQVLLLRVHNNSSLHFHRVWSILNIITPRFTVSITFTNIASEFSSSIWRMGTAYQSSFDANSDTSITTYSRTSQRCGYLCVLMDSEREDWNHSKTKSRANRSRKEWH